MGGGREKEGEGRGKKEGGIMEGGGEGERGTGSNDLVRGCVNYKKPSQPNARCSPTLPPPILQTPILLTTQAQPPPTIQPT